MAELGSAQAFRDWTRKPRFWGDGGSVMFGGGVVGHLIEGLAGGNAAIGCVPWFTSTTLAERLSRMTTCVVLDKRALTSGGDRRVIDRLLAGNWQLTGFPVDALKKNADSMLLRNDGTENYEPIRVAGQARVSGGGWTPLVHAKLLVVGNLRYHEYEADTGHGMLYSYRHSFEALRAWVGSANFTHSASAGIELGVWITEPSFVGTATEFISDLILHYSEPPDSASDLPAPERFTDEADFWKDFEPDYEMLAAWDDAAEN